MYSDQFQIYGVIHRARHVSKHKWSFRWGKQRQYATLLKTHWVTTSLSESGLSAVPTPPFPQSFPLSVSSTVSSWAQGKTSLWPPPTALPSLISQRSSVSHFLFLFCETLASSFMTSSRCSVLSSSSCYCLLISLFQFFSPCSSHPTLLRLVFYSKQPRSSCWEGGWLFCNLPDLSLCNKWLDKVDNPLLRRWAWRTFIYAALPHPFPRRSFSVSQTTYYSLSQIIFILLDSECFMFPFPLSSLIVF